jgi:hypothetical protein
VKAPPSTGRIAVVGVAVAALVAAVAACPNTGGAGPQLKVSVPASPKQHPPSADLAAAASYGEAHRVRTAIAVLDLKKGRFCGAGDYAGLFGAASVAKVLIAVKLLATGQMTGRNATLARAMIERSDDAAVAALWPLVGGAEVVTWVASHYRIPYLGTPTNQPGVWGNTHITALGMVYLYRAIANDPEVGPWLIDAMRRATPVAADGTHQFFGIPSAATTTGFAVKQGWGERSADAPGSAVINTTGYVNGDRYAVAILAEGIGYAASTDDRGYNAALAKVVTRVAELVMPGGRARCKPVR